MTSHEQLTWRVRANYYPSWRALGGHLTLSAEGLAFEPHGLDRATGGNRPWAAGLEAIVEVRAHRSGMVPRKRLVVRTADGVEALFLVPRVEDRARELRQVVGLTG